MISYFTKIYIVLKKESNQYGKLLLEAEMSQRHIMNFLFNVKAGNCFAKVLEHLIIIEYFQLNDHAFFNIHHSLVLKCLGSNGWTDSIQRVLFKINSFLVLCYDLDGFCYQFVDKTDLSRVSYILQHQIGYFLHNQSYLKTIRIRKFW